MLSAIIGEGPATQFGIQKRVSWLPRASDFETQVQPELALLYRVARRQGCTSEEAEDVVQQTLIKAFQAWSRFDGRHLRSWLIRILRNERLMNLRSKRGELSLDEEISEIESTDKPFWEGLAEKMQAELIIAAIDNLPEAYRMTVHLCDVEQLSYEEVAESLSVPVGTVRSRLFRARAQIRKKLEDCVGGQ